MPTHYRLHQTPRGFRKALVRDESFPFLESWSIVPALLGLEEPLIQVDFVVSVASLLN